MDPRVEVVAEELVYHRMGKNLHCICGHEYRLGESIMIHRAQRAIEALNRAGL